MKDFLKSYHSKNHSQTLSIIGISFILALSINFWLGNGQFGKSLKSSVVDRVETQDNKGDVYLALINDGKSIVLKAGKPLNNISKINFSISYNPTGLKLLSSSTSVNGLSLQNTSNEPGYQTSFGVFQTTPSNIAQDETIATFEMEKLAQNIENINLISVNIEDTSHNITELSSSGIDF